MADMTDVGLTMIKPVANQQVLAPRPARFARTDWEHQLDPCELADQGQRTAERQLWMVSSPLPSRKLESSSTPFSLRVRDVSCHDLS